MELTVNDARSTAMWRFHDAAMERAALMYTFSRSTYEEAPGCYEIYGRQLVKIMDTVHEFCFNARRAIERAEEYLPGIVESLEALKIHHEIKLELSGLDSPESISLTQKRFLWVLGRIIHSRETQVIYRTEGIVTTNERSGAHHSIQQPVGFAFSSDYDSKDLDHYVHLESLSLFYVRNVAPGIESAINARNKSDMRGA